MLMWARAKRPSAWPWHHGVLNIESVRGKHPASELCPFQDGASILLLTEQPLPGENFPMIRPW